MAIQLTRRGFLQALGFGAVAAAAPALLEPRRKIWQVGADIGRIRVTDIECVVNGKPLMCNSDGYITLTSNPPVDDDYWARWTNRKIVGIAETDSDADGHVWVRVVDNAEAAKIESGLFGLQGSDYPESFDGADLFRVNVPGKHGSYSNRLSGEPLTHASLQRAFERYEAMLERDPIAQACIAERIGRNG